MQPFYVLLSIKDRWVRKGMEEWSSVFEKERGFDWKNLWKLGKKLSKECAVPVIAVSYFDDDELLKTGGHIGDGIRPGERRKGYATAMIALALDECKKLGINKVLMCCNKDNIGSAKSIINNGGVLENEVEEDGHIVQRYWIQL